MSLTLSPMQHRVAGMYAAGLTRHEIARRLGLAVATVDDHWLKARRRLGVDTRREVAALLPQAEIRFYRHPGRTGLAYGDRVRVTGGRCAGRVGAFVRIGNSEQAYVEIGRARYALRIKYLARI